MVPVFHWAHSTFWEEVSCSLSQITSPDTEVTLPHMYFILQQASLGMFSEEQEQKKIHANAF